MEELTAIEQVQELIFSNGWDRLLKVEESSVGSGVLRIRERPSPDDEGSNRDYSEPEIVGLYNAQDIEVGKMPIRLIKYDCRNFLLRKGMIR